MTFVFTGPDAGKIDIMVSAWNLTNASLNNGW